MDPNGSFLPRASVCGCIHNRDEQRHAQSQAVARASLARILRYHELLAMACLLGVQCQPPQSSEIQRCKRGLYQYVLWPCDGSNRDRLVSEDILEQLIFQLVSSHSLILSLTMFG